MLSAYLSRERLSQTWVNYELDAVELRLRWPELAVPVREMSAHRWVWWGQARETREGH